MGAKSVGRVHVNVHSMQFGSVRLQLHGPWVTIQMPSVKGPAVSKPLQGVNRVVKAGFTSYEKILLGLDY